MSNSAPPLTTLLEFVAGFNFEDEFIHSVAVSVVHDKRRYDAVLSPDNKRAYVELVHDPRQPLSYTYQYVVHFHQPQTGGVSPIASPERTTDSRMVIIPGRETYQLLRVQLVAAVQFSEVRQMAVEVRPRARTQNVASAQLDGDRREWAHVWVINRDDPADYDYRVTVEPMHGELRRGPWLHSDKTLLLVSEYPGESRTVEARLVGKDPAAAGIVAAKIRFSYDDADAGAPPQQAEFEVSNVKPVRWTYWFSNGRPETFTYQFTLVRADGKTQTLEPVTSTDLVILQPIT